MLDIVSILPAKRKVSPKGWISFCCPVCHLHGHSPDKRSRGGLKMDGHNWTYNCFNCGHTANFTLGRQLSFKARQLLLALGLDQADLAAINLESLRHRDLLDQIVDTTPRVKLPEFEAVQPPNGEVIDVDNPQHAEFVEYLRGRNIDPTAYPYVVDLSLHRPGITIPFTHHGALVGHTTRFLDDRKPKYITEQQVGYVFGYDLQDPAWTIALVMEGPFCALSVNGLAVNHQTISDEQAAILNSLDREIVVVPDQNKSGLSIIDRAMDLGYSVSIPSWDPGIEDVNDAVKRYGRIGTLLTILEHKESSQLKIKLRRKWLVQRIQR